jgi:hypothetical protein
MSDLISTQKLLRDLSIRTAKHLATLEFIGINQDLNEENIKEIVDNIWSSKGQGVCEFLGQVLLPYVPEVERAQVAAKCLTRILEAQVISTAKAYGYGYVLEEPVTGEVKFVWESHEKEFGHMTVLGVYRVRPVHIEHADFLAGVGSVSDGVFYLQQKDVSR